MTQVFLKILFLLLHCSRKYITQIICDVAVDDSLTTLKVTPYCFLQAK